MTINTPGMFEVVVFPDSKRCVIMAQENIEIQRECGVEMVKEYTLNGDATLLSFEEAGQLING